MGYQESLVTMFPAFNFDKLIKECAKLKKEGFYNDPWTVIPLSVVIFKQKVGNMSAGTKALWVCGDRSFHGFKGLVDSSKTRGFNFSTLKFTPADSVIFGLADKSVQGIDFSSNDKISENSFMKRYPFHKYAQEVRQKNDKVR